MQDTFVDFRVIKQQVSMEAVLSRYQINLRRSNRTRLRGRCPLPTHTSETSKESFGVDVTKNIWACQSASCAASRQGKRGGNVIDFVAVMENCSIRDAALKLNDWFGRPATPGTATAPATPDVKKGREEKPAEKLVAERKTSETEDQVNKPLSFRLQNIDSAHPYLRQRGIKEETAKLFGVGFFPGRGSMNGRVVIPIENENGELLAYAGRSIDGSDPKYKVPSGFLKSAVLFNTHRALAVRSPAVPGGNHVIVVEGFFDCLKVHQAGRRNVVALMGSSLSDEQRKILRSWREVTLFLDGDEAGRQGSQTIAGQLLGTMFVKVVKLPDGKQPDQLSSAEINAILGSED